MITMIDITKHFLSQIATKHSQVKSEFHGFPKVTQSFQNQCRWEKHCKKIHSVFELCYDSGYWLHPNNITSLVSSILSIKSVVNPWLPYLNWIWLWYPARWANCVGMSLRANPQCGWAHINDPPRSRWWQTCEGIRYDSYRQLKYRYTTCSVHRNSFLRYEDFSHDEPSAFKMSPLPTQLFSSFITFIYHANILQCDLVSLSIQCHRYPWIKSVIDTTLPSLYRTSFLCAPNWCSSISCWRGKRWLHTSQVFASSELPSVTGSPPDRKVQR